MMLPKKFSQDVCAQQRFQPILAFTY